MFDRVERTVDGAVVPLTRRRAADGRNARAKLVVGAVDDPLEREADRVADRVLATLTTGTNRPIQETAGTPTRTRIRRSTALPVAAGAAGGSVDTATESRIQASKGVALDATTRSQMEPAFGTDLSRVRIHARSDAADLNRALGARAFTVGSDVYFGAGEYRPRTPDGQRLLAHELAHTQSGTARRAPVIRRFVQFRQQKDVPPDKEIRDGKEFTNLTGFKPDSVDEDVKRFMGRYVASSKRFVFDDLPHMVAAAQGQAAVHPFVMKAEESSPTSSHEARSTSASSRYDFRNNPRASLPDAGPDPTQPTPKPKQAQASPPAYYYHVTSYSNLKRIFDEGLNPAAGGGVGGSSFHNADADMNKKSADDSKGKVFVATVGKLTQRYLSFRLRQDDLFKRHSACIVYVLANNAKLGQKAAELLFAQISLGEEPIVLRFANTWAPKDWTPDPIDKEAFALKGKPVPAASIQCLTVGGWASLTLFTELANIIGTADRFAEVRSALLSFYGKHNKELEAWSEGEGWSFIPKLLAAELNAKGIAAD